MSIDSRAYRFEGVRYNLAIGIVRFWRPALIGLAVLAAFLYGRCGGEPPPTSPGVVDTLMVPQPTVGTTLKEKIVYRPVEVERRVVQTEIDTVKVREFIESATDTLRVPIHLPYSIEYDGERLLMWGVMSDGTRSLAEYDVRPTFRAGWNADSTWAREERLARFPAWKVGIGAAVVAGTVACLALCR